MATLVYVDKTNTRGLQIATALDSIKRGLADLEKFDGMRAQTIAVGPDTFGAVFGIASPAEAQAFSDRWASISSGNFSGLSDFLDATIAS